MTGPYFGPFLSSLILSKIGWRASFWIVVGLVGFGLLLVVLLMEETTYDRVDPGNNPVRPDKYWKYKALSLTGVMGHRAKGRPTLWEGTLGLAKVFIKPQFYLLCKSWEAQSSGFGSNEYWIVIYHGMTYMWSVGINGTLILFLVPAAPAGYGFGTIALGLIYLAPMTAVVVGELWGHFVSPSNSFPEPLSAQTNKKCSLTMLSKYVLSGRIKVVSSPNPVYGRSTFRR